MASSPWWIVEDIIPGGPTQSVDSHQQLSFSEDQQKNFGIDACGTILDQAKFDAELARVKKLRGEVKLEVVPLDKFPEWRADVAESQVVHIKGFGCGMGNFYNDDVLALLKDCELLVWDGDDYDATGFTQVIPLFLKAKPSAKAVGFKINYELDILRESWASLMKDFPGRIAVVPVDLVPPEWKDAVPCGVTEELKNVKDLPSWAQEYFVLGRVACKATGSKLVISLGGGGISANEALAGINDGMEWHIFALSRGRVEQYPTILNFARAETRAKLITGKDPKESDAFAPEATSGL